MLSHITLCVCLLVGVGVHAGTGPIFMQQPVDTLFDTESNVQSVSLDCSAKGDGIIHYSWMRNEDILDSATNERLVIAGGTLTITFPVRLEDEGNYTCFASNNFGKIRSLPARLSFAYVESFDRSGGTSMELTVGNGGCLDCNPPNHYPGIVVSWTRAQEGSVGQPVSVTSPRTRIMEDGRLCFAYVTPQDTGDFRCHVRSNIETSYSTGEKISPVITVSTNGQDSGGNRPSRIIEANKPKDVSILIGERVLFECFFFGRTGDSAVPPISWSRPGTSESLPQGSFVSDNAEVLIIPSAKKGDAGTYRCSAGGLNAEAELTIVEPPSWVQKLISVQKDISTDVTFNVDARSDSGEVTYTWYRNSVLLENMPKHQFRDNYKQLTITNLQVEDSAMYQCFAQNKHGKINSSAQLTVREFVPEFTKPMRQDQPAPLGATVTIECPIDGAPYPQIHWSHDGQPITASDRYNLTSDPPNLVIVGIQSRDAGEYTCSATNSLGTTSDSGSLIFKDATMIVESPENTEVMVGASVTLECKANHDSSLELRYVWQHNVQQIDFTERQRFRMPERDNGNLEIMDVQMEDGGDYTCDAVTVADFDRRTATLTIVGPPGPPSALQVTITGNLRSANLQWAPGSPNNSPITSFTVEAKTNHDDEWVELRSGAEPGENSVRLTDLAAYSLYTFRVYAVNAVGAGVPSEPVTASQMTAKDRPETAPANVGGGGGNEGDLRITWDAFPRSQWNSGTVWYTVEWRRTQSEVPASGTTQEMEATVFVATTGIELYTQYEVRVQAVNDINSGPWSEYATVYSYQEDPKTAPTGLTVTDRSSTSIDLTWNGIDPSTFRGELLGYKLKYWAEGSDKDNANTAISNNVGTKATIPGLEPNTRYSVLVQAYSGGSGNGPESSVVTAVTLKNVPQQRPTDVVVSANGNDIEVEWSSIQTSATEEDLQGYKIRYRPKGVYEEDAKTMIVEGTATEATIKNLDADTTYLITIQGYSAGGDGVISDPPVMITTGKVKTGQASDRDNGGCKSVSAISLTLLLASLIHTLCHLL